MVSPAGPAPMMQTSVANVVPEGTSRQFRSTSASYPKSFQRGSYQDPMTLLHTSTRFGRPPMPESGRRVAIVSWEVNDCISARAIRRPAG
jgi:hypothetical protein